VRPMPVRQRAIIERALRYALACSLRKRPRHQRLVGLARVICSRARRACGVLGRPAPAHPGGTQRRYRLGTVAIGSDMQKSSTRVNREGHERDYVREMRFKHPAPGGEAGAVGTRRLA
jgi:hypothetical protein